MITHIELGIIIVLLAPWKEVQRQFKNWRDRRAAHREHQFREKVKEAEGKQ